MSVFANRIANSGLRKSISSKKVDTKSITLKEQQSQQVRSALWVRNDNPDVIIFTDDEGTEWLLNDSGSSSLSPVLTAGNDATGLDVTNLGSLTFDTAGPQGINIGTDVTGATTALATQIAIGEGASAGSGSSNTAVGVSATITATAGTGSNLAIGTSSNISGAGTSQSIVVGGSSVNPSVVVASNGVCIGAKNRIYAPNDESIAIGYENSLAATALIGKNIVVGRLNRVYSADYAMAIGHRTTSRGDFNVTVGSQSTTGTAQYNVCIGRYVGVSPPGGDNIILMGKSIYAGNNTNMINVGYFQYTNKDNCTSLGHRTKAYGANVVTVGLRANCYGDYAIAMGAYSYNRAAAASNISIGRSTYCYAASNLSISIGDHVTTNHAGAIVIGSSRISTAANELTIGTTAKHIRIPFTLDATAPTPGGIVLPNATTMLDVTINGDPYQIALFAP